MGSITRHIDDIISEFGSWDNYLKVSKVKKEQEEIVKALFACINTSDLDRSIIKNWHYAGIKEHSVGTMFRMLYRYREQCAEVYQKHIDHPYCKPR